MSIFAKRIGLVARRIDFVQAIDFGDAVDHVGDIVAEAGANIIDGRRRVFDHIVQKRGADGGGV